MKIVFLGIATLVSSSALFSCKTNKCVVADPHFVDTFNVKLGVIKAREEGDRPVGFEEYGDAIVYLGNITGITTRGDYSSTLGYRNHKIYKEDMSKWKSWLKKNKCVFTIGMADSVLNLRLQGIK
ncbi:MAG: hypothetical protein QM731_03315 [Chitinophagaceae bacterium]